MRLVVEVRSLLPPLEDELFLNVLNVHASLLKSTERYQEALLVREKQLAMSLRVEGPDHPQYATSCMNAANLYTRLKQIDQAIEMAKKALAIRTKTFGASHPLTQSTQATLAEFRQTRSDPEISGRLVSKSDRMCNVKGCQIVKKKMSRCMRCLSFYLCKKHEGKIDEHIVVCLNSPDVLPDEKKLDKIVKCRRCRKQTKLMKCAVCKSVWYCGAQCQKDDWKRHKVFCGKKE